jgi:hypothetical protein
MATFDIGFPRHVQNWRAIKHQMTKIKKGKK